MIALLVHNTSPLISFMKQVYLRKDTLLLQSSLTKASMLSGVLRDHYRMRRFIKFRLQNPVTDCYFAMPHMNIVVIKVSIAFTISKTFNVFCPSSLPQ